MLKILKRIKWLLTEAPTSLTDNKGPVKCTYCGSEESGTWTFTQVDTCVCYKCIKKTFDLALVKGEI